MADFVKKHKLGVVVKDFSSRAIIDAIEELKNNYDEYVDNTKELSWGDYDLSSSQAQIFGSYKKD